MGKKVAQEEYIVKDIVKYKVISGKEMFLVWWEGFPVEQSTWQPVQNMIFLKDYQEYYEGLKKQALLEQSVSPECSNSKQNEMEKALKKEAKIHLPAKSKKIAKPPKQSKVRVELEINDEISKSEMESESYNNQPLFQQIQSKRIYERNCQVRKAITINKSNIRPMKFNVVVHDQQQLLLIKQKLKQIKSTLNRNNKNDLYFEVEFENSKDQFPRLIHQRQIQLLYPQEYARFLVDRIKE